MPPGSFTHPPPITQPKSVSPGLQQKIETHTGVGVSDVQIYPNTRIIKGSGEATGAQAYATGSAVSFSQGNQIFLAPGQDRLMAHELAHIVQQRGGSVSGTEIGRMDVAAEQSDPGSGE
jgi:hypothetical protein